MCENAGGFSVFLLGFQARMSLRKTHNHVKINTFTYRKLSEDFIICLHVFLGTFMPEKQRIPVGFSNVFIYLKSLINKGKTLKTIEILF